MVLSKLPFFPPTFDKILPFQVFVYSACTSEYDLGVGPKSKPTTEGQTTNHHQNRGCLPPVEKKRLLPSFEWCIALFTKQLFILFLVSISICHSSRTLVQGGTVSTYQYSFCCHYWRFGHVPGKVPQKDHYSYLPYQWHVLYK